MNIRFNSVILDGFMSFDHEEIELSELGIVMIKGRNEYEPLANSNGSGKSAISEAVLWSITGYTSRGANDVANSILNRGVYVTIDLDIDENHYVITRSKNHSDYGSNLTIIRNGEDISGNTLTKSKKILEDELGGMLDYDTLTSIIVLSQGLPGRLSTLKPASRKSRLEELSNTDSYIDDLKTKISSALATLSASRTQLSSEVTKCRTQITASEFNIETSRSKILTIQEKVDFIIDAETATLYETEVIPQLNREVANLNEELYRIRSRMSLLNSQNSELDREFESGRVANQGYLDQYSSLQAAVCPLCKQPVQSQADLDALKAQLEQSISSNKLRLGEIIQQKEKISAEIQQLNSDLALAEEDLKAKSDELAQYVAQLNDYKSYSSSTSLLEESIGAEEAKIRESQAQLSSLNEQIAVVDKKISIANYYNNQLSRKFRSFLLEGVINYMNHKSIEYSSYLFEKQGTVTLEIEGNNINIYLGNRRFEDLSGGEGRRVDIVLQLIQRDLARNESGFTSNILVMDEILDNLDSVGADSVIRLLEHKSPDVETMLIVSHKQDITIPSDRVIKVVKSADQLSHISKGE